MKINRIIIKGHHPMFFLCIFLTVVSKLGLVINFFFAGEILKYAVDGNMKMFYQSIYVQLGMLLFSVIVAYILGFFKQRLNATLLYSLRERVINSAINYSDKNFEVKNGQFTSIVRDNLSKIINTRLSSIYAIIGSVALLCSSTALAFYNSYIIGIVILLSIVISAIVPIVFSGKMNLFFNKIVNSRNEYSDKVEQNISNLESFRFLNGLSVFKENLLVANNNYEVNLSTARKKMVPWFYPLAFSIIFFNIVGSVINGFLYYHHFVEVSAFLITISITSTGTAAINDLINAVPSLGLSKKLFNQHVKLIEQSDDSKLSIQKIELKKWNVLVENKPLFENNQNITFKNNNKILVTGRNGIGKSMLFFSMLNPTNSTGQLLINGETPTANWYFNGVWMLPTIPKIFAGNVLENISLFEKKPNKDKASQILEGLKLGNLKLSEEASVLSDGQKQRLALARALYFEPEWLFLDESLSSIDQSSAKHVLEFISKKVKTIVLVSHHGIMERGWFDYEIEIK